MPRRDYFYALHVNSTGDETAPQQFYDKEFALTMLAVEVGEELTFANTEARHGSHTLKCFANRAGRPGELLETFLVATSRIR